MFLKDIIIIIIKNFCINKNITIGHNIFKKCIIHKNTHEKRKYKLLKSNMLSAYNVFQTH